MPYDYCEVPLALLAPFVSYVDVIVFDDLGGLIQTGHRDLSMISKTSFSSLFV